MSEKILWNSNWEFVECPLREEYKIMPAEGWRSVTLPHDWLIEDVKDLYRDSIGWYRKRFTVDQEKKTPKEYLVRFDGIYMDSTIYVNGRKVMEWKYGYSTFEADITPYLQSGVNEIAVRVINQYLNTRWYSGAGIYRNVWWKERCQSHIVSDGIYISTDRIGEDDWNVEIDTEVVLQKDIPGKTGGTEKFRLEQKIFSPDGREIAHDVMSEGMEGTVVSQVMKVNHPALWEIGQGNLYRLVTGLYQGDELLETEEQYFGFRTVEFTPDRGFFLNGRPVKINGVCEHHDLGCLGAAFSKDAMRRKFCKLRSMGVNAIRTSHNMPAPEVMELADEMGFLIDSEAFDMWEKSKTPFDYGRFFKEWYKADVASWIRRDRNHPSIIMWSIGNEIPDTVESEHGQEITEYLIKEVKIHDPKHHAPVTLGSNFMKWEHARACGTMLDLVGYNYSEYLYEEHHKEHPEWVIYGSETASLLASRGIYHFPKTQRILTEEDEQCSALGNSVTGWGAASYERCICDDRDAAYSLGQFLWTGFDYIGESTPYKTKNSYFGQLDTAGFPKDSFYLFQAEWTDVKTVPMIHVFPYWDFNPGQMIDLQVCSNAPVVELIVNGASMGKQRIDHAKGKDLVPCYRVPYEPGCIEALAYDEEGNVIARDVRHSFGDAVKIHAGVEHCEETACGDRTVYDTGISQDIGTEGNAEKRTLLEFIAITVLDKNDNPVENANNRIFVEIEGAGKLLGLDSGDSTDFESYQAQSKCLFSGKLLAVVERQEGEDCKIRCSSPGLVGTQISFPAQKGKPEESIWEKISPDQGEPLVRKIELCADGSCHLTPEHPKVMVHMKVYPESLALRDDFREEVLEKLEWKIVNDAGILLENAQIERKKDGFLITAHYDGAFRLRVLSRNGRRNACVMSHLEMDAAGFGETVINPYKEVLTALSTYRNPLAMEGVDHGMNCMGEKEAGRSAVFGFDRIDFGDCGTKELTVWLFANTEQPVSIQIWDGFPDREGSCLLVDGTYHKTPEWMVFQPETYHLDRRLTGRHSLYFETKDQYQFKSFLCTELWKAYERLCAADCDRIYGDSFIRTEDSVKNIGNNVSIAFEHLDFGTDHACRLLVIGRTDLSRQPVQLRWTAKQSDPAVLSGEQTVQMIYFTQTEEVTEQVFELEPLSGKGSLEFIFLPGSSFDFYEFQFLK